MAADAKSTCYDGSCSQSFQFYLRHSGEHEAIFQCLHKILPGEFKRIGLDKSSLDVLGVGSGGGEVDAHILTLLQSTCPSVPITADIVEGSADLTDSFKALVAKTPNLQKIPFAWHLMTSENYEKQVKAKGDIKKFDFIQMVQMIYYVDNLAGTIAFHRSLLKSNGRLMIIVEAVGWDGLQPPRDPVCRISGLTMDGWISRLITSSQLWLGHPVEDLQEGARRRRHHGVPLVGRGHRLPEEPGSEIRGARRSQRLRHHRVLRSQQRDGKASPEFHDGERHLLRVLHPGDQSGDSRPSQKQVQH
ncbi:histamine N-methyltransferase isoform X1 [Gasterosteus aculeatus]